MDGETTGKIVKMTEMIARLHDGQEDLKTDLKAHAEETRKRWERYDQDRREHDAIHAEQSRWQVKKEEQLRQGSESFSEHRRSLLEFGKELADVRKEIRPPAQKWIAWAVAAVVSALSIVGWVERKTDPKADKAEVQRVASAMENKADKSDVNSLSKKIDDLATTIIQALEKKSK